MNKVIFGEKKNEVFRDSTDPLKTLGFEDAGICDNSLCRWFYEHSPAPHFILTLSGYIWDCNRSFADLMGCDDVRYIKGVKIYDFFTRPADGKAFIRDILENEKSGNKTGEWVLRNSNGDIVTVWASVELKRDESGAPELLRGTLLNLTDHLELETKLSQHENLVDFGRLSGNIVHDFNNILAIIAGHCRLMYDEAQDNPELSVRIQRIMDTTKKASALTKRLLSFCRHKKDILEKMDITRCFEEMEYILQGLLRKDVHLEMKLDCGETSIYGNLSSFEQIFINLVKNAQEAIQGSGNIRIDVSRCDLGRPRPGLEAGSWLEIAVKDTGKGISRAERERLFSPWYSTKTGEGGAGIGLASVYRAVKETGGRIFVDSEPGKGTTFTLYFPLSKESASGVNPRDIQPAVALCTA